MRGLPSSSGYGQAAARRRPVAVFSGSDLPIPDCPPLRLTFRTLTAVAPPFSWALPHALFPHFWLSRSNGT